MPNEPAESNFKQKVEIQAYPCLERNGVIWTYMGPRKVPPPLPHIEANILDTGKQGTVFKALRDCNYMQALEGDIDTSHSAFLHGGARQARDLTPGSIDYYKAKDRAPRYAVLETEFGTAYGGYRTTDEGDKHYWRIAYFLFPFYTMIPTGVLGEEIRINAWVPIDSEHTMAWRMQAPSMRSATQGGFHGLANVNVGGGRQPQADGTIDRTAILPFLPDTSDWLGKSRLAADKSNDYLIDREAQKNLVSYTGINGGYNATFLEDAAVTESMGQIYDRSKEHLGTSDSMIIRTRRRLINSAKDFRDHGTIPPGVDQPEVFAIRSGGVLLPKDVDWWEGTEELRKAFVEHRAEESVPMPRP